MYHPYSLWSSTIRPLWSFITHILWSSIFPVIPCDSPITHIHCGPPYPLWFSTNYISCGPPHHPCSTWCSMEQFIALEHFCLVLKTTPIPHDLWNCVKYTDIWRQSKLFVYCLSTCKLCAVPLILLSCFPNFIAVHDMINTQSVVTGFRSMWLNMWTLILNESLK